MFGIGKAKTVQIRLLVQLVTAPPDGAPMNFDRGQVVDWPADDARRLIAAGCAKYVTGADADAQAAELPPVGGANSKVPPA